MPLKNTIRTARRGLSLLEVLAAVVILGVLATLAISRVTVTSGAAERRACEVNRGDIDVQVQLWYRDHGSWPAGNLSDLGADASYFPQGLPTCPVDGAAYTLDPTTHRVTGHAHP